MHLKELYCITAYKLENLHQNLVCSTENHTPIRYHPVARFFGGYLLLGKEIKTETTGNLLEELGATL
jgi:hypothetical protein